MKKLMLLLMSIMLCLGMTACANGEDMVDDNGTVVEDTGDNNTLPENVDNVDLTNPDVQNNGTTTVTP